MVRDLLSLSPGIWDLFNLSGGPRLTFNLSGGPRLTFNFTGGQTISFWTGDPDLQFKTPLWFANNPSLRTALNSSMSGLLIRMDNIAFRHCGFSIVGLSYRDCFQVENPRSRSVWYSLRMTAFLINFFWINLLIFFVSYFLIFWIFWFNPCIAT